MNPEDYVAILISQCVAAASSGLFALICFCALSSAGRTVVACIFAREFGQQFLLDDVDAGQLLRCDLNVMNIAKNENKSELL